MKNTLYDFTVKDSRGNDVNLSKYQGNPVIIVNTASKCGLVGQFEELETLYESYKEQGLVIIGFPCNQFANQETGTNDEIQSFCKLNYGVTFPVMAKIEVNGDNQHPLYKFLKSQKGGLFGSNIKWNFTKFLIDKNGEVVKRFSPTYKPLKMKKYIEKEL